MNNTSKFLIIFLVFLTTIAGIHFFQRTFGLGQGFTVPIFFLDILGFSPGENDSNTTGDGTLSATRSADGTALSAADRSASGSGEASSARGGDSTGNEFTVGSVLAVPYMIDENASAAAEAAQLAYLGELQPAAVVLFGKAISASAAATHTAEINKVTPSTVIMVDHEGGAVQRLSGTGFTKLPTWSAACQLSDEAFSTLQASSAAQLRLAGVDVILGPVLDLKSGGYMGARACDSSPEVVAARSQLLTDMYTKESISTVLKHFPGIGSLNVDLHKNSGVITLKPEDTQPFEAILNMKPSTPVMMSFARIALFDPLTPCALSQYCVGEFRKKYPQSLTMTDALEMDSAGYLATSSAKSRTLVERSTTAIAAGNDLLLFGPAVNSEELQKVVSALQVAYTTDTFLRARLQLASKRVNAWRDEESQQN